MTESGISATAPVPPAYRDGNVLRWLAAYTASVTGDVVYFLALSWSATGIAGPAQVGVVIAAGALPRAVLMLGGGVLADRFGPRRVAIGSDATRCMVILAAAAVIVLAPPSMWLLLPLALIFGVVDALFMPAVGALPPRITEPGQLARVQGMRALSIRLSNAAGPVLAGFVLAIGGAAGAFTVAGVLFAVSLVLLLTVCVTVTTQMSARVSAWRELGAGLRYIRRHRTLAPLVIVIGLSEMCFSGPFAIGLVLLADARGWGASGMGWIAGAFSIGGAAAALLMTVAARIRRAGPAVSSALLGAAVATVALGYAPALPAAVVLGALVGLTTGISTTVTSALVQTQADPRYLGRVTSVTTLCTLGLAPVMLPAAGVIVALWGAATFFVGCSGICLLAAAVSTFARAVRRAELAPPRPTRTASP